MFLFRNNSEAYWNSYRLLENQFLRLSHSIFFDDNQIDVYSSELADIINSACVKIESLAKDIYEDHIWPFQKDNDEVPQSYLNKKPANKFKAQEWIRDKWKFDHNCLNEINSKFFLYKKRVSLKTNKFHFQKYGSAIIPFGNMYDDCKGGFWEYSEGNYWKSDLHILQAVDWCKSYQAIKHNYIQSITNHGTVKNAIMVLAAFYLLAVYQSCLPFRQFKMGYENENFELDFGSNLFSCDMCNYLMPPCIVQGNSITQRQVPDMINPPVLQDIFAEQELLNDIDGFPFLITMNNKTFEKVNTLIENYCKSTNINCFDIGQYQDKTKVALNDPGFLLYQEIKQYIEAPYYLKNVCVSFNTGADKIYTKSSINYMDYEKSKYLRKNKVVLDELKIGDFVEIKYELEREVLKGEIVKNNEYTIELSVKEEGRSHIDSHPKSSIVFINKIK